MRTNERGLEVPMEYECKGAIGTGHTTEISLSGVRIREASKPVEEGDQLQLRFSIYSGSFGTVFNGEVVRKTPDGFEVGFVDLKPHHLLILLRL